MVSLLRKYWNRCVESLVSVLFVCLRSLDLGRDERPAET